MAAPPPPAAPRPPSRRRAAAWLLTGPLGHLAGGVADWAELLTRHVLARARERAGGHVARARERARDVH
jgi:hypothetical protein